MKFKLLLGMLVACLVSSAVHAVERISVDDFFKNPQFASLQLSPDGKELAALANVGGRMNIVVMNLEERKPRVITSEKDQDVSRYLWANNERILFFMDRNGSESFGIFAINKDGSKGKVLVEPIAFQLNANGEAMLRITQVVDVVPDDPDWVLVSTNERRPEYADLKRLNVYNGRTKMVERNPGDVARFFLDWDGNVIGASFSEGLESGFKMLVDRDKDEWVEVVRARFDEPSFFPVGIKGDGEHGWVQSTMTPDGKARDKSALYEYNFKKLEFGDLVREHDEVDCCGLILNRKKRDAIGMAWAVGKPERVYTDEKWKFVMANIDKALPDTINAISSIDDEETVAVVVSTSATQPARYYLYNFEENSLEWLLDSRPWLKPEQLVDMQSYSFTSRDGMTMHGYLTLPKDGDGKNLPLIVNPHGGPWGVRDSYGYNPQHQFLANRGYAVIQVNFRGSGGFGRNHLTSSWKQWGQNMQNDITDAVKWAVDQGIADPERVCIFGGSYGGYAAMAGLTFTPELYKCGINFVGVTDLPLMLETAPNAWGAAEEQMYIMMGNPNTEKEFLEQWSPVNHADKIVAPVFMAYGAQDPRVNIEHLRKMEQAMDAVGAEYHSIVKEDEGHGFRRQENRIDIYNQMETFLAENIGEKKQVSNVNP